MVGVKRFELPTSCSQSRRATRLRYTPTEMSLPGNFGIEKPLLAVAGPRSNRLLDRGVPHLGATGNAHTFRQATIDFQHE